MTFFLNRPTCQLGQILQVLKLAKYDRFCREGHLLSRTDFAERGTCQLGQILLFLPR